jgi:hypothetical protein
MTKNNQFEKYGFDSFKKMFANLMPSLTIVFYAPKKKRNRMEQMTYMTAAFDV